MQAVDLERKAMAPPGGEASVEGDDVAAVRLEVAVLLRRVVGDVAALERKFAVLRRRGGADEELVEAVLATRMAMGTLAPLAERWAVGPGGEVEPLAALVGRVLREALAAGSAHVETQSGAARPCAPGVAADRQGLIEAGGQRWDGRGGTVLYWLEDRRPAGEPGCFAMGGAELVAALKSDR
ncbi:MAG: hypothetical protein QOG97_538, partial [Acidimicrobiaceae bacterium]|nr:hypothetical protein [Acidimicrobiaceae bacterium]